MNRYFLAYSSFPSFSASGPLRRFCLTGLSFVRSCRPRKAFDAVSQGPRPAPLILAVMERGSAGAEPAPPLSPPRVPRLLMTHVGDHIRHLMEDGPRAQHPLRMALAFPSPGDPAPSLPGPVRRAPSHLHLSSGGGPSSGRELFSQARRGLELVEERFYALEDDLRARGARLEAVERTLRDTGRLLEL